MIAAADRLERARIAAGAVPDPEIPVLTLADLGILRQVDLVGETVRVHLLPTYVGCPATDTIRRDVEQALADAGLAPFEVKTVLSPPWTTDLIGAEGREKLRAYGIAPPARAPRGGLFGADAPTACPRCGSADTEKLSEFGSTPCKAHWRCRACREPFDAFKCL